MTTAHCTPEAVLKRLGDLDLPDSEVGMIVEAIEDASDAARDYGSPTWVTPLCRSPSSVLWLSPSPALCATPTTT